MLRRGFVIFLALVALAQITQAKTRRHRKSAFHVALQPFVAVHIAVHAVADPVVENAPRAVAALVAEPVRVAYYTARRPMAHPGGEALRAEPVEDEVYDAPENDSSYPDQDVEPEIESAGSHPMVNGSVAVLRNGIAYAPSQAPQAVKEAIWAVNTIRTRPYVWGGGHGSFRDYGYDCSGTVSFALHGAGAIGSPLASNDLMRFGERGRGRWFTIYSRPGHTFAVIAGLRLDTTDFERGGNVGPRWHAAMRDTSSYVARHPYKL